MSDAADKTLAFGLLMETAQAHQRLAETQLERLRDHAQELDSVVRDEIRRTFIEELQGLSAETRRAVQSLERIRRAATLRSALWSIGVTVLCASIPVGIVQFILPTSREIGELRTQREALNMNIAALQRQGGRIDLKHCGADGRLCVRVDSKAPKFGEKADYYVVAGY
jgi:uncharacterized protein YPO0396